MKLWDWDYYLKRAWQVGRTADYPYMSQQQQHDMFREERAEAIQELIDSRTWREYIVPALRTKRDHLAHQVAASRNAPLEDIRWQQCEWNMLDDLLENPKAFFGDED